jgi:hypothetical protein
MRAQSLGARTTQRQHTSAYVSICQHTSANVSKSQHTSAYVSIRQHVPLRGSVGTGGGFKKKSSLWGGRVTLSWEGGVALSVGGGSKRKGSLDNRSPSLADRRRLSQDSRRGAFSNARIRSCGAKGESMLSRALLEHAL